MNINLIWKALFGILALAFIAFGLTALILNFGARGMDEGIFTALTRFSSFAFFVCLFFAQIIALFFFVTVLGWAIKHAAVYFWLQRHSDAQDAETADTGTPTKSDSNSMGQMPRLFSVVTATAMVALFFSNALRAVFDAIVSFTTYVFGTLPQTVLAEIDRVISCVTNESDNVSGPLQRNSLEKLVFRKTAIFDILAEFGHFRWPNLAKTFKRHIYRPRPFI